VGPDPRPPFHDPMRAYFTLLQALSIAVPNTTVLDGLVLGDDIPPHTRWLMLEAVARARERLRAVERRLDEIERRLSQ
jgi:Na+/H+-translocating membrane pyrophosphatase